MAAAHFNNANSDGPVKFQQQPTTGEEREWVCGAAGGDGGRTETKTKVERERERETVKKPL